MDEGKLNEFLGQMLGDLGGAFSIPLVRMGNSLGIYKALAEHGPITCAVLAERTGLGERYLREWLSAQAASNYIAHDNGQFSIPPEQAAVLVQEDSPVYMMGAFDAVVANIHNQAAMQTAFRTGEGVQWGDQPECLFCAVAKFFRPGYQNHIVQDWVPALDRVAEKLEAGGAVADVGCGHGYSTHILAEAFPASTFTGFDFHEASIVSANEHLAEHPRDNVGFEVADSKSYRGEGYDLITMFDCLHHMGDPVGAAAHARKRLKPDGKLMLVEPMAADDLDGNLNPVGRLYYSASTMVCVPTSLAQEVGAALGAQAGEAKLTKVLKEAGFSAVRRAAETPFNMILEATP